MIQRLCMNNSSGPYYKTYWGWKSLTVKSHHDRVAEHRAHSIVHKSRPQQQGMGWSQGQLLFFLLTKEESGSHLTSRGGHTCGIAHSALEDHRGTFQQPSTPDYEILQDTVWRLKVIQCSPPSWGMQRGKERQRCLKDLSFSNTGRASLYCTTTYHKAPSLQSLEDLRQRSCSFTYTLS